MKPGLVYLLGGVGAVLVGVAVYFATGKIAAAVIANSQPGEPAGRVFERAEHARVYTWMGDGCSGLLVLGGLGAGGYGIVRLLTDKKGRDRSRHGRPKRSSRRLD